MFNLVGQVLLFNPESRFLLSSRKVIKKLREEIEEWKKIYVKANLEKDYPELNTWIRKEFGKEDVFWAYAGEETIRIFHAAKYPGSYTRSDQLKLCDTILDIISLRFNEFARPKPL